jgi:hypothetical protein
MLGILPKSEQMSRWVRRKSRPTVLAMTRPNTILDNRGIVSPCFFQIVVLSRTAVEIRASSASAFPKRGLIAIIPDQDRGFDARQFRFGPLTNSPGGSA